MDWRWIHVSASSDIITNGMAFGQGVVICAWFAWGGYQIICIPHPSVTHINQSTQTHSREQYMYICPDLPFIMKKTGVPYNADEEEGRRRRTSAKCVILSSLRWPGNWGD